jgi:hypothetical protein
MIGGDDRYPYEPMDRSIKKLEVYCPGEVDCGGAAVEVGRGEVYKRNCWTRVGRHQMTRTGKMAILFYGLCGEIALPCVFVHDIFPTALEF